MNAGYRVCTMNWLFNRLEFRKRAGAAIRFAAHNPPRHDESKEDYAHRMHAAIVEQYGLPPLKAVKTWVRRGVPGVVPPRDQIEKYLTNLVSRSHELDPKSPDARRIADGCMLLGFIDMVNEKTLRCRGPTYP
jgi:hypothetical protein